MRLGDLDEFKNRFTNDTIVDKLAIIVADYIPTIDPETLPIVIDLNRKIDIMKRLLEGEKVLSNDVEYATGWDFSKCCAYLKIYRTAEWWSIVGKTPEERARNGQKIEVYFRINNKEAMHGKWVEVSRTEHDCDIEIGERCNLCGRYVCRYNTQPRNPYCPGCGAKMNSN